MFDQLSIHFSFNVELCWWLGAEDSYPNEMKQAELSVQLGLTYMNCRCGSTIAGSRTGELCQPRLLGRLKDCKCVTGKHTCMLSPVLSFRFMNLHIKWPQIFYAIIDKLCWSARYSIVSIEKLCLWSVPWPPFFLLYWNWMIHVFFFASRRHNLIIYEFMNCEKYSLNYQCNMVALFCLLVCVSLLLPSLHSSPEIVACW